MLIDLLLFSHCSYYLFHFSYFIYKLVWPFSHGLMFYFLGVTVQRVIKFITQRVPGSRDWIPQFFAETVRAYNPHTYKHILHLQATENNSLGELFYLCSILDHNTLMGSIPRAIGKLQNLTVLNLSTNQLMGPIPSEIGDMRKISTMYCSKSYDQLLFLSTFNFEVHNPHLLAYALETFTRIG
jgi:hypothetical protein